MIHRFHHVTRPRGGWGPGCLGGGYTPVVLGIILYGYSNMPFSLHHWHPPFWLFEVWNYFNTPHRVKLPVNEFRLQWRNCPSNNDGRLLNIIFKKKGNKTSTRMIVKRMIGKNKKKSRRKKGHLDSEKENYGWYWLRFHYQSLK